MMPDRHENADFYAALLRTNGAILRAREREPLLNDICRICVDNGAATLAYVALVDGDAAHPVAWAGPGDAFLPGLTVPLDPARPGRPRTARDRDPQRPALRVERPRPAIRARCPGASGPSGWARARPPRSRSGVAAR